MRLRFLVAGVAMLAGSIAARADTISFYTVNGTLQSGTLAGIITIDVGQYVTNITAVNIVANGITFNASTADSSSTNLLTGRPIFQNGDGSGDPYAEVEISNSYNSLYLVIANSNGGFRLCTATNPCSGGSYTRMTNSLNYGNSAMSGSVTAVTPEPSSIALLGTGLLAVAVLVKKRFTSSRHRLAAPAW